MLDQILNIAAVVGILWFAGAVAYLVIAIALVAISNAICSMIGPNCANPLYDAIGLHMDRMGLESLTMAAVWFIAVPFHILWTITDTIKALRPKKTAEPFPGC